MIILCDFVHFFEKSGFILQYFLLINVYNYFVKYVIINMLNEYTADRETEFSANEGVLCLRKVKK